MKKIIFLIILISTNIVFVTAHPLDISFTVIKLKNDGFSATSYLHQYEVSLLLKDNGISIENSTYNQLTSIILPYFNNHFKIYSKSGILKKESLFIEESNLEQILSAGLYINYDVSINISDYPITFYTDLFIEYFSTQTNKIVLLDSNGNVFTNSSEIILTNKIREWTFNLKNPDFSFYIDKYEDSDSDGLTDHFEKLYGLNYLSPDTDNDGFSDSEEFNYGWDPFNPALSPGQTKEAVTEIYNEYQIEDNEVIQEGTKLDDNNTISEKKNNMNKTNTIINPEEAIIEVEKKEQKNLIKEHGKYDDEIKRNDFLEKTLTYMKNELEEGINIGSILVLFGFVFALGFLHASMPGHGKGILISFLTENNKKLHHAIGFIFIFTFTHLIDVVIIAFVFYFFSSMINASKINIILQMIGGIGLIVISVYLIIKSVLQLAGKISYKTKNIKTGKNGAFIMGILTGLAPCPFGWYLLLMLNSIGQVILTPFVIIFFGFGIFVFLFLIAISTFIVRYVAFDIFSKISKYSPLISGIMMFIFAILFFFPGKAIQFF